MKAYDAWILALENALLADSLQSFGLHRSEMKDRLDATDFLGALQRLRFERDRVCAQSLELCAPLLEQFCEATPAGGYLAAAYEYLSYALYPDANRAPEEESLSRALLFYVTVLGTCIRREAQLRPYDPLTDVFGVTEGERGESRLGAEYDAFCRAAEDAHYVELMRLARECMPFDPLSHTSGVHHVAVHMARQAKKNGVPVDIALVSAAALSHDIGKFGCRGEDTKRIPYLHYYYTNQWLLSHKLPNVAHIASNHSTWDLEYENLPVESLLLIYADFRVRGARDESGREKVAIHTLAEAGGIIFGKLADNTLPEKRNRYRRVYQKLCDFEDYLIHLSVNPDPLSSEPLAVETRDPALLFGEAAAGGICRMAITQNIALIESVSASASFERLLERARSEKNLDSIRTYLNLLEEYLTYMTRVYKLHMLSFLYELLMHPESDVRRQAGQLMGRILANAGLKSRKELPENAPETAIAPTLSEMLAESAALWDSYIDLLLQPDHKINRKHAVRIVNSLKVVAGSLFAVSASGEARAYLDPLLRRFQSGADRFALLDAIVRVPANLLTADEVRFIAAYAAEASLMGDPSLTVAALSAALYLSAQRADDAREAVTTLLGTDKLPKDSAVRYLAGRLAALYAAASAPSGGGLPADGVSELYLMNLKSAVHWIVKAANIDCLYEHAQSCPADAYHVATHLSNLLLISEHLPVRERAGDALMRLSPMLRVDQRNEIVIDLCRGLETGQQEFSKYVPPCLGFMIRQLPELEREEAVLFLESMVRAGSQRSAGAALSTLGQILVLSEGNGVYDAAENERAIRRITGILLSGLAHFDDGVHRAALSVLCRDVFSCEKVPLMSRRALFLPLCKKLLTLLSEKRGSDITFFNTAAMLNHVYRMIIDCRVELGGLSFELPASVAFFPGTFDPFSSGHKRIVTEILALGFEVYLAVDEFSWSKRTQPKLLRRQITVMSVADQPDAYLFPDDIPINLANPDDLARLRALFPDRPLYLVAGSDVVENASAYADKTLPGAANSFDHILFPRSQTEDAPPGRSARERLTGRVVELTLPTYYEDVSSSRIREHIDKNLEISMLVDPVVEMFIQERGLYLRTPQYKQQLAPIGRAISVLDGPDESAAYALRGLPRAFSERLIATLRQKKGCAALLIEDGKAAASAAVYAHTIDVTQLLGELLDVRRAERVRMRTSGKLLFIDGACCQNADSSAVEELVNELLTHSLGSGHTYAVYYRGADDEKLYDALTLLGFLPVPESEDVLLCDMRSPLALTCDAFTMIKEPYCSDPDVRACILRTRKALRKSMCGLFPGTLALSFDLERINHVLIQKVQHYNGVLGLPASPRRLGPFMCVPYGVILSDVVVPNTVTKALHVEKVFEPDVKQFAITEDRGYSTLVNQLRVIRSFRRPVLLVDDLLHNGYRMEKLDPLFKREGIEVKNILVGILSGRGKDLMDVQGRSVDAVYVIPNLRYWFTESLLYPFFGGDSVRDDPANGEHALPSINLIYPYRAPDFIHGSTDAAKRRYSMTALKNAYEILLMLERRHQALTNRSLTLSRLGEALSKPRLPDRGAHMLYDRSVPASAYVLDDIGLLRRLGGGDGEA